jgi:hypothetical protein
MLPLATFDELQMHLGRTLDDQDGAEQALQLASGAVRAYCHWEISRNKAADMQAYGDGSRNLTLATLLLRDVVSIAVDGVALATSELSWSRKGQIRRLAGWCKDSNVDVIIDHGYDHDEMPDAITLVTLDAAARHLINPEALVSASTGEVSRTWSSSAQSNSTLSTLHQVLLDNYRVM